MITKKTKEFKLTPADRVVLDKLTPQDYRLFADYYFGVDLWDWQNYFLQYPCKNKLVVAGIRSGKSFNAAYMLLQFGYWNPGSRLLNVSVTADQALIIYNDILSLADSPRFRHWVDKPIRHPYPMIPMANGTEIWCRSVGGPAGDASTLRGWEFDVINIDEAAYLTNELAYKTLQGRLIGVNKLTGKPRYGMMTLTTTPKGAKTWLFERWKLGDSAYPIARPERYLSLRARTFDNLALDQDLIKEILADYTDRQIQQELEGIFISDDNLFSLDDLMIMCGRNYGENILDLSHYDPDVADLEEGIKRFLRDSGRPSEVIPDTIEHYEIDPEPNHTYIGSWDLGARAVQTGRAEGRNATVGVVYDITTRPWRLVAWRYDTQGRYSINMARAKEWHLKYQLYGRARCFTRIDALGPGDVIHQMLEEEGYRIDGFRASALSKGIILQAASVALERRWTRAPYIRRFIDQFQSYDPTDDKNIAQDVVISVAQAMHLGRELEMPYSNAEDVLKPQHGTLYGLRGSAQQLQSTRESWGKRTTAASMNRRRRR